jgi:hypothetical protein
LRLHLGAVRRRRQMSSPNGSLANLLVTRKSLDASDTRTPLARNL